MNLSNLIGTIQCRRTTAIILYIILYYIEKVNPLAIFHLIFYKKQNKNYLFWLIMFEFTFITDDSNFIQSQNKVTKHNTTRVIRPNTPITNAHICIIRVPLQQKNGGAPERHLRH